MELRNIRFISVLVAFLLFCEMAQATTYQYIGNNYGTAQNFPSFGVDYTTEMGISATFMVAVPLTDTSGALVSISGLILDYSFSDGQNIAISGDSILKDASVIVDGAGIISGWNFEVDDGALLADGDQIFKISTFSRPGFTDSDQATTVTCGGFITSCIGVGIESAGIINNAGSWTVVPIPASALLFSSALGLLGWMRRKPVQSLLGQQS